MTKDIWVVGGTALTMDARYTQIESSAIHIRDGKIAWIGKKSDAKIPNGAKILNTDRCLVLPGFFNGHSHAGMTLLKGMANDVPLTQWLRDFIFPLEKKWVSPEFVSAGNQLACAEMIRAGVTSFADMYYHQEHAAKAVHQAGLRMSAGTGFPLVHGPTEASQVQDHVAEFCEAISSYPRIEAALAPHALYSLEEKQWSAIFGVAKKRDLLVQVHISESADEAEEARKKYGLTTVKVLESFGLWENRVLAAHCVELTEEDIEILGKYGSGVAYNPESNMKLGNRICPVVELKKAGAKVCFGTDGVASNNNLQILQEADMGLKMQSFKYGPGAMTAKEAVRMLTIGGAEALGWEAKTGSLELGKEADLIAIDIWQPHIQPLNDLYAAVIFSATSRDIKHSIVAGQILMEGYELKTLKEEEILLSAARWSERMSGSKVFS